VDDFPTTKKDVRAKKKTERQDNILMDVLCVVCCCGSALFRFCERLVV
jgi:hypothetical protein